MSSLRNSLHRRNHKERSQLAHRARYGILEKHKDYVLRARDYHSKQQRIKRLQQKAADRNKDEFYFGMTNQRTEGGVHVQDRGNVALPTDIVKVLKSQDENYIRTMRTLGLKKIDKLKAHLTALADLLHAGSSGPEEHNEEEALDDDELSILVEAGILPPSESANRGRSSRSKHLVFVQDEGEVKSYGKHSSVLADGVPAAKEKPPVIDLGWKVSQSKRKLMGKANAANEEVTERMQDSRNAAKEHRSKLLKELSARLARDQQLRYAERELEMQKLMMGKGARKKIRGVEEVEGSADEDEDEDDEDAPSSSKRKEAVDIKLYKPRVYKWKLERRR